MPKNGRPASAPLRSRSERVLDAPRPWYKVRMPSFRVETPQGCYNAIVERGIISRAVEFVPAKSGKVFVVSTDDVWRHQGAALAAGLRDVAHEVLYLPGGEENKRMAPLESLAERMVLAIDPAHPRTLWVGSRRLWRTTRDGREWQPVSLELDGSAITAIEIPPAAPGQVWAGTRNGGIFRSLDDGET